MSISEMQLHTNYHSLPPAEKDNQFPPYKISTIKNHNSADEPG